MANITKLVNFRTKEIKKFTKKAGYNNPNTFEAGLQIFRTIPRDVMVSYRDSSLVNSPSNVVQTVFPNRKGEQFSYTVEDLNKRYIRGNVIDLESIDFSNIVGCHQELEFKFKAEVHG